MNTPNVLRALALAASLAGLAASASAQVINGGFETGNFSGWTQFDNTGATGVDFAAHSGTRGASFGPVGSTGGIYQNVSTTTGASYDLTFWLANDGGTYNSFSVSWDGLTLNGGGNPALPLVNAPGFGYTQYSFLVTGSAGSDTELRFTTRQDPAWYHLDDVQLTQRRTDHVPDSGATAALVGLGLVGMVAIRRRVRP